MCLQAIGHRDGYETVFVKDQFCLYSASLLMPDKFDYIDGSVGVGLLQQFAGTVVTVVGGPLLILSRGADTRSGLTS